MSDEPAKCCCTSHQWQARGGHGGQVQKRCRLEDMPLMIASTWLCAWGGGSPFMHMEGKHSIEWGEGRDSAPPGSARGVKALAFSQMPSEWCTAVMGMCRPTPGGSTSLPPPSTTSLPVLDLLKVATPPAGYSRMVSCTSAASFADIVHELTLMTI